MRNGNGDLTVKALVLDKETAIHIQAQVLSSLEVLNATITEVSPHLTHEALEGLKRKFAEVIANLDLEILEPIYRSHPELRERDAGAYPPYQTST